MSKAFGRRWRGPKASLPKGGKREDLGFYVRSKWEANMVRFYRFTKTKFEYEVKEFEFVGLKRGNRFYKPDFYLVDEDRFVEVKGFLDKDSLVKLKRLRQYYPDAAAKLRLVIDRVFKRNASLSKEASALISIGFKIEQLQSYSQIDANFRFLPCWEPR